MSTSAGEIRPVRVCRALLEALDATEGRRRRRKRNTSADAIGIGMKRELLEAAIRDDPDSDAFEGWLMERCFEKGRGEGAWRAMALDIFQEWRMAQAAQSFRAWLEAGAPSDDKPGRGGPRAPGRFDGRDGNGAHGRPGLPVLLLLATFGLGLTGCEGEDPDYGHPVPTMETVTMDEDQRQRTGMTAFVVGPMRAGPGPGSTIYDPAVDLRRPPNATEWPLPTGAHGDEAAGRTLEEGEVGDQDGADGEDEADGGDSGDGGDEAARQADDASPDAAEEAPDTAGAGSGGSNVPEDSVPSGGGSPDGPSAGGSAA